MFITFAIARMDIYHKILSLFKGKSNNLFVQLFRYTFVGGLAFLVDFGLLFLLTHFCGIHYLVSAGISFIAGLAVNYALSKIWVFSVSSFTNRFVEFLVFAIIGVIGLGFNELFMYLFTSVCAIHYLLSKIITTVIVYFWNFFARKYLIFTKDS
jgi:putative flippase GtrA